MSSYLLGTLVLGASVDLAPGEYGPLSPEQLSRLDRKLTPAEQAAVSEWQSAEAERQLAVERAKGGPRSETVLVTPHGAVIKAESPPKTDWSRWLAWGAVGLGAAVVLYFAARGTRPTLARKAYT